MDTIPERLALCNSASSRPLRRSGFRVPFGLREDRFWAPSEVPKGKACGCNCPGCGAPLAAKAQESRRKRPHFAHLADAGCATGTETGIHGRAKQLVAERQRLLLPAWEGDLISLPNPPYARDIDGDCHTGTLVEYPERLAHLENVQLERSFGTYQPDVSAEDELGELLIEIRVTHAVDQQKAERVQAHGRRMVEIDLSRLDRAVPHDPDAFERVVLFDRANRHWISCPAAMAAWEASRQELAIRVAQRNREIALTREEHAQAAAKRRAQASLLEKDKVRRKAHMRTVLRAKYAQELAQLVALTDHDCIERVLGEYQQASKARVMSLLDTVPAAIRSACLRFHHDAWIFGVDPVLWQLQTYQHFVGRQASGSRFNQKDVASWVRRSFHPERALYRLFIAQYAGRAEARRAGVSKWRLDYWVFTEEENARIPNFYEPINDFIRRLEAARLIRVLASPVGECEVLPWPATGLHPVAHVGSNVGIVSE